MLRQIKLFSDFSDGAKSVLRLFHRDFLPGPACGATSPPAIISRLGKGLSSKNDVLPQRVFLGAGARPSPLLTVGSEANKRENMRRERARRDEVALKPRIVRRSPRIR
jgi:hypothetical protein